MRHPAITLTTTAIRQLNFQILDVNAIMIMVDYMEANRDKPTLQTSVCPITRFLREMAERFNGEISTQTVKVFFTELFEKSPKNTAAVVKSFVSCFVEFLNESGYVTEKIVLEKKKRGRPKRVQPVAEVMNDDDDEIIDEEDCDEDGNKEDEIVPDVEIVGDDEDDEFEDDEDDDDEDDEEEDDDDDYFDGVPLGCRVEEEEAFIFDRSKMRNDYYEIFGIAFDADDEALKKAYLTKAREFHPDRNRREDATQIMASIAHIYDILSDETERRRYNITMGLHPILKRSCSKPEDYLVYFPV
jgi:hypothetical protein